MNLTLLPIYYEICAGVLPKDGTYPNCPNPEMYPDILENFSKSSSLPNIGSKLKSDTQLSKKNPKKSCQIVSKDLFPEFSDTSLESSDSEKNRIFNAICESAKLMGNRRRAFRQMLETYVSQLRYSTPQNPRILNLGCGQCEEALVLSGYFGNKPFGSKSDSVQCVGIDIDQKSIDSAISLNSDWNSDCITSKKVLPDNYKFINGDASFLKQSLKELVDSDFDIIVARHPQVFERPEDEYDKYAKDLLEQEGWEINLWGGIFQEAYKYHKTGGIILVTNYHESEAPETENLLRNAGYKIELSCENMHAIHHVDEAYFDKWIIIARKTITDKETNR